MNVRKEQVDHVGRARRPGHVHGRLAIQVGVLQVGARRQVLHNVPMALPDGDVDGQGAMLVGEVQRGAVLHQDLQSVQKARPGGVVHGGDAVFVLHVGVGTLLQQEDGHLGVAHHHHLGGCRRRGGEFEIRTYKALHAHIPSYVEPCDFTLNLQSLPWLPQELNMQLFSWRAVSIFRGTNGGRIPTRVSGTLKLAVKNLAKHLNDRHPELFRQFKVS